MGNESMHEVTIEWLQQHATARGGYTKRQLQIVGVEWPPEPGWKSRAAGTKISLAAAAEFERLSALTDGGRTQ